MFFVHMLLLLAIIFVGIRHGGVAFGLLGGLGVSILAFVFGVAPGSPPINVMLIILAVVAASATLEATGGLKLLVRYAEKLLRKHPNQIVFLGPLCTYSLTVLVGTGHSVYPLLPVIYDVAYKKGIRPERPLDLSVHSLSQPLLRKWGSQPAPLPPLPRLLLPPQWKTILILV